MAFDFLIQYKQGSDNLVADALSRKHEEEIKQQQFKIKSHVIALSLVVPN